MERPTVMPTSGGLVSTCLLVLFSTLGGMAVSLLQSLDAATRGVTGPQATLIIGGLGLLWQVGKWLFYDRRRPKG